MLKIFAVQMEENLVEPGTSEIADVILRLKNVKHVDTIPLDMVLTHLNIAETSVKKCKEFVTTLHRPCAEPNPDHQKMLEKGWKPFTAVVNGLVLGNTVADYKAVVEDIGLNGVEYTNKEKRVIITVLSAQQ